MKNELNIRGRIGSRANGNRKESDDKTISYYYPNAGVTTPVYSGGELLDSFAEGFVEECFAYLNQAKNLDEDNGGYMDQRINSMVELAVDEVLCEHVCHKKFIQRTFGEMFVGDRIFESANLDNRIKELEELETELEMLYKIFRHKSAFETYVRGTGNESK